MPPKLTPVDHDPFAEADTPPVGKLVPVEGDPFKDPPKTYAAADVPGEAVSNLLPSVIKQFESMGSALAHPLDTASSVARLAMSPIMDPVATGALAVAPKLPDSVRRIVELLAHSQLEPAAALRKDYGDAYGSWDKIKRTAAEDPARLLMDLSIPFTGGAAAAPRATGTLAKAAGAIGKATDLPGRVAQGAAKAAEILPTEGLGLTTAAGATPFKEAAKTGFYGGQGGIDFRAAMRSGASTDDVVGLAKQGIQTMKDRMMAVYQKAKDDPTHGWSKDATVLDFTPIDTAWTKLRDSYLTKSGKRKVGDAEWNKIQDIGETINEWRADPASHTVEGLDGLKQRIANFADKDTHPQVMRAATRMSNAVKDEIVRQAPGYATAMKDYAKASKALEDMESAFSLGRNGAAQTSMSKLQSIMRNNASTQYGHRLEKVGQLEHEGLINLMSTLAGHSLNSWSPRGITRGVVGGMAPAGAAALGAGMTLPTLGAGLAGLASTSPRLMGEAVHGAGRVAGIPFRAARRLGAELPAGYSSLPNDLLRDLSYAPFSYPGRQIERIIGEERPERRRGGYFSGRP